MDLNDEVILWKAPQPGRDGEAEVRRGFDAQEYPGFGPFFSLDQGLAEEFQTCYQNGLQEFYVARAAFEELVRAGIIEWDPYLDYRACFVRPGELSAFNAAILQGTENVYHPQASNEG